jgi:hypothetical protein
MSSGPMSWVMNIAATSTPTMNSSGHA